MISDTNHNFELTRAPGIKYILIADGHQSEKRLKETDGLMASLQMT